MGRLNGEGADGSSEWVSIRQPPARTRSSARGAQGEGSSLADHPGEAEEAADSGGPGPVLGICVQTYFCFRFVNAQHIIGSRLEDVP